MEKHEGGYAALCGLRIEHLSRSVGGSARGNEIFNVNEKGDFEMMYLPTMYFVNWFNNYTFNDVLTFADLFLLLFVRCFYGEL